MKIHQIAIRVPKINMAKILLEQILNADFKIEDECSFAGMMGEVPGDVYGVKLIFDHSLLEDCNELELINCDDISHWHNVRRNESFLSHLGVYCESGEELDLIMEKFKSLGMQMLQDTISFDHSRSNGDGSKRSYRDIIYDTEEYFGFNLKFSLKLTEESNE